jgi:hypothetical protein
VAFEMALEALDGAEHVRLLEGVATVSLDDDQEGLVTAEGALYGAMVAIVLGMRAENARR